MPQVAFVGCAHIHTPGFVKMVLERTDGVWVKYCWDPSPVRSGARAGELGAKVVKDLDEVWRDRDVSAVVICSETVRHPELVRAAARAGKHLFVEKPLGISAVESYEMADAITRAGVIFQ